jgi:hypothetical protein
MDPSLPPQRSYSDAARIESSSPLSSLLFSTPVPSSAQRPSAPGATLYNEQDCFDDEDNGVGDAEDDVRRAGRKRSADNIAKGVESVIRAMRAAGWTLEEFLEVYVTEKDIWGNMIVCNIRNHRSPSERQSRLLRSFSSPAFTQLRGTPMDVSELKEELKALRSTRFFGKFDHTTKVVDLDLDIVDASVRETAPRWHTALNELLYNQRSAWGSYSSQPNDEDIAGKIFMITSMVCFSQAKQQSNFLASMLDVYLLSSGVKRRAFSTLAGLGICHSYKTANNLLKDIAEAAKVRILNIFQSRYCIGCSIQRMTPLGNSLPPNNSPTSFSTLSSLVSPPGIPEPSCLLLDQWEGREQPERRSQHLSSRLFPCAPRSAPNSS